MFDWAANIFQSFSYAGKGPISVIMFVDKKVSRLWGLINLEVVCKGGVWVSGPILSCPENCFTSFLLGNNLGLWNTKCGNYFARSVLNIVLEVNNLDMGLSTEAAGIFNDEFTQSCGSENGGG